MDFIYRALLPVFDFNDGTQHAQIEKIPQPVQNRFISVSDICESFSESYQFMIFLSHFLGYFLFLSTMDRT